MARLSISVSDIIDDGLNNLSELWGVNKSTLVGCIIGQYFQGFSSEIFIKGAKEYPNTSKNPYVTQKFADETLKAIRQYEQQNNPS